MIKQIIHYSDLVLIVAEIIVGLYLIIKSGFKNNPLLFLGLFMLSLSTTFIFIVLYYTKLYYSYVWTIQLENVLVLSHAPFYYIFVTSLLDAEFKIKKQTLLHFLPALIGLLITIPFYLSGKAEKLRYLDNIYAEEYPLRYVVIAITTFLQYIVYYIIGFKKLMRFSYCVTQLKEDTEEVRIWINSLIIIFYTSTVLSFFPGFVKYDINTSAFIPIVSSPYFLFIVYTLLQKPHMFMAIRQTSEKLAEDVVPDHDKKIEHLAEKYTELADRMHREIIKRSLYKDPDICLSKLADILNTRPYVITWILKNHYNETFYNYINAMRIEEAKKILSDSAYRNYTIDYIGQLVGFNSKSVFYNAFKKNTGETPTQFVRRSQSENIKPGF